MPWRSLPSQEWRNGVADSLFWTPNRRTNSDWSWDVSWGWPLTPGRTRAPMMAPSNVLWDTNWIRTISVRTRAPMMAVNKNYLVNNPYTIYVVVTCGDQWSEPCRTWRASPSIIKFTKWNHRASPNLGSCCMLPGRSQYIKLLMFMSMSAWVCVSLRWAW